MISNPIKYLGTLALLLSLTPMVACTQKTATDVMVHSPFDEQGMVLKIKMQDAIDALDSSEKINALLGDFGDRSKGGAKGRINKLLNTPGTELAGLGASFRPTTFPRVCGVSPRLTRLMRL